MGCVWSSPRWSTRVGVSERAASGRLLLSTSGSESAFDEANHPATPQRSPNPKRGPAVGHRVVGDYSAASNGFSSDQDRFVVWPDIVKGVLLLGVFDGHGPVDGGTVAEMAADRIPAHFQRALQDSLGARIESSATNGIQASEAASDTRVQTGELSGSAGPSPDRASAGDSSKSLLLTEGAITQALRHAFAATQRELDGDFERTVVPQVKAMKERMQAESGVELPPLLPNGAGTTATVAVLHGKRLYVAWVGDSRAALISCAPGSTAPLGVDVTRDHDVDNEAERARAEEQGGAFVGRHVAADGVEGMVQTLRSLGDVPLHQSGVVSAEPEIECLDVDASHAALLIASDGVWNHMTTAVAAGEIMEQLRLQEYQQHLGSAKAVTALKRSCEEAAQRVQTLSASSGGRLDDSAMVLLTFAEFWEARKDDA